MVIPDPYESFQKNNKNQWWHSSEDNLHYAQYQIKNTTILVGARPDYGGTTYKEYKSIEGWINVSDRFVRHEKGVANLFAPWNEGGQPQIETIFTILKTLDYWINELQLSKVYIHCDGGTHRGVSMLGFYLLAYEKDQAQTINNNYTLVRREHWSNPLEYAQTYLDEGRVPALGLILEKIKDHTIGDATHGKSLEDFLKYTIGDEHLREYYYQRFIKKDLAEAFWQLKFSFKNFFKYTLWHNPKAKISIFIHKKLNTKKGQWYKKHNF